jgi:membrane protease YdiL (CAAX protease family)
LGYLSMILPAIAVLIVHTAMHEPPRVDWNEFPLQYLPAALFLMPAVLHAVMLPVMAALNGGLEWQVRLTPGAILVNAIFGLAVVSFLAFFEEIGWRAWLLPRFHDRMGARRAVVVTAIVWALWHVPYELAGILHIEGVSPVKMALMMPFGTMASGLILGWLWLRTESIWIVSITHGSLNNWGQYAFKYMKESGSPDRDLAVLSAGSVGLFVVGALLVWRYRNGKR